MMKIAVAGECKRYCWVRLRFSLEIHVIVVGLCQLNPKFLRGVSTTKIDVCFVRAKEMVYNFGERAIRKKMNKEKGRLFGPFGETITLPEKCCSGNSNAL